MANESSTIVQRHGNELKKAADIPVHFPLL